MSENTQLLESAATQNVESAQVRSSSRERKLTEKGLLFQKNVHEKKFKAAVSSWRCCVRSIFVLLSDETDVEVIRSGRNDLEKYVNDVKVAFEHLVELNESDKNEIDRISLVFDSLEIDHQNLMCEIATKIRDLQLDIRSHTSVRSSRCGSILSKGSKHSDVSKRSNAMAEAAALKTKLRFIDAESKAKAELDKVITEKKLAMVEAKIDVFEAQGASTNKSEDGNSSIGQLEGVEQKRSIPHYVSDYLEAHKQFWEHDKEPDTKNEIPDLKPQVTFTSVAPQVSASEPTVLLPSHSLGVSSALNPLSDSFQPQALQPLFTSTFQPVSSQAVVSSNNQPPTSVSESVVKADNSHQDILKLTSSLAEQLALSRLPPPEPNVFTGDPLEYPSWKSAFHTLIEQKGIPSSEKIHYLQKYLSSEVRAVVSNFFLLSSEKAYDEAKLLLDKRYGDKFVIANAFRDKLDRWPKIQSRDSYGLRKFADFLKQCLAAMETIGCLNVLDDERENRKMLAKLPDWVMVRWNRIAVQSKEEKGLFPSFKDFMLFVSKEANIACDPVTSLQSFKAHESINTSKKGDSGVRFNKGQTVRARSFKSEVKDKQPRQLGPVLGDLNKIECVYCKRHHALQKCYGFLAISLEKRKTFAQENGLCFGCLRKGHIAKRCFNRMKCEKCNKMHPTLFHEDRSTASQSSKEKEENEVKTSPHISFLTYAGSYSMSSMILPVHISHESCPEKEIVVYAMLDSQSDTTFILEDVCKSLGVSGVETSLLLSTMYAENKLVKGCRIKGLVVRGYNLSESISLPETYTRQIMPANRSHIPTTEMAKKWSHLKPIEGKIAPLLNVEVGLLIGYNCSRALIPRDVIVPDGDGPFAQRTDLGWSIVGIVDVDSCHEQIDVDGVGLSHRILVCEVDQSLVDSNSSKAENVLVSFRNKVKPVINPSDIVKVMNLGFDDCNDQKVCLSRNDKLFMETMKQSIKMVDGHYELPLPLKDDQKSFPNNRVLAVSRLQHLRRRLSKDSLFYSQYCSFMQEMIDKGYAEKVTDSYSESPGGRLWYIPHHGVFHAKKPDKLRVVFDCSAEFLGESLNRNLLQGPDLTNALVGVLCRFRKDYIPVMCDIEKMFFQFLVSPSQRDLLRFLWWENGNLDSEPVEYRMCVHLFGAASSPGCANFGLKQIACDFENEFGSDVANFVRRDFYVDDGLTSLPNVEEAVSLLTRTKDMLCRGGLRLHKFLSSSKSVLDLIPPVDRAQSLENVDLHYDTLPIERALGAQWSVELDSFQFRITLSDQPLTRRGVLSTVNSVYDPLGFISPVILIGKQILQHLCADQSDWDDPIPEHLRSKWESWRTDILQLKDLNIPRCFKPVGFGKTVSTELHHFSDASQSGYGQCSYLKLVDDTQRVHCSLVMSKSRVAPLKTITIPRLELSAAVLSVKISDLIQRELDIHDIVNYYWTDSKVVLGYIANDSRRFQVFVANRVQLIHDHTKLSQWSYVDTKANPADIASRGASVDKLLNQPEWFSGPRFLWQLHLPSFSDGAISLPPDDKELKRVQSFSTETSTCSSDPMFSDRFSYFSSWNLLRKAVALCLLYVSKLRKPSNDLTLSQSKNITVHQKDCVSLSVSHLEHAEKAIVKIVQSEHFNEEISLLKEMQSKSASNLSHRQTVHEHKIVLRSKSSLYCLDPYLDQDGILRVGGRLQNSKMSFALRNPVILPKKSHVTDLIIRHFHVQINHQGRGMTSNEIRANGYWVLNLCSAVYHAIDRCVTCRRLRGYSKVQKMGNLPKDRLECVPPFTYCGVDYFGPWLVREGRKDLKRYGVVFTCLSCRAIHLEVANSLSTDSFINALRRFIALRGPIRELRSDRGSNFIGAERELREALAEMDESKVERFLLSEGCDYFAFNMNVPHSSHMGGVWERQIRSVRSVLAGLLHLHGQQLDDESLRTFMSEVTAIINSRPLSAQNLNDAKSVEPLTPNHLLTMKSKIILPPPGNFQRSDLYCRRRWRRIQYLANEFWSRWRKEYVQNLQARQKWVKPSPNLCVGDIVLIVDESLPRSQWRMGKVTETFASDDGLVRKVRLMVGSRSLDNKGCRKESLSFLDRPVHKLILLYTGD